MLTPRGSVEWRIDEVCSDIEVAIDRDRLIAPAMQADRYHSQPRVLEASGLEDQCVRIAVLMLMPKAFQAGWFDPAVRSREQPAIA